jgi:hypothetical protein
MKNLHAMSFETTSEKQIAERKLRRELGKVFHLQHDCPEWVEDREKRILQSRKNICRLLNYLKN